MKKGQRRREQQAIAEMRWVGFAPDTDEQDEQDDPDQEFEGEVLEKKQ